MRPHAHIVLAGPCNLADVGQLLPYLFGVRHQSVSSQLLDVLGNLGAGLGVPVGAAPVGLVAQLDMPKTLGIIWPRPTLAVVPVIPQRVERLFMARGGDVQCLATGQLYPGGQRMDVRRAVCLSVQHSTCRVLVTVEASKGHALEVVDHLLDLLGGWVVLRCPRDDTGCIPPLVRAAVGHLGHQMRVATHYRDFFAALAVVVFLSQQVTNSTASAALAVSEKLDMHGYTSVPASAGS